MDQTYRPKLLHVDRSFRLWQQDDEGLIEAFQASIVCRVERTYRPHEDVLDSGPTRLVEARRESVGTWGLIRRHSFDRVPNELLGER